MKKSKEPSGWEQANLFGPPDRILKDTENSSIFKSKTGTEPGSKPSSPAQKSQADSEHPSVTGGADTRTGAHTVESEYDQISRMTGVTARVYWNELQIIYPRMKQNKKSKPPERTAGDIVQFSRKSRLRMIRILNRVHHVVLGEPIFLTLTARPECFEARRDHVPPEYRDNPHAHVFTKEFMPMLRQVIPEAEYIWKMEPHKSGEAHYHLLVWSRKRARKLVSEFYAKKLRRLWRNCIDDHSRAAELYSLKINRVTDEAGVFNYMSKYMLKEEEEKTAILPGRRWGRSRSLPISPILEMPLRMDAYERIRDIAIEILKRRKANTDNYIDQIKDGGSWFIWLDKDTILNMLQSANRFAEASKYKRFLKTGNRDPGDEELAAIAAEYGIDY